MAALRTDRLPKNTRALLVRKLLQVIAVSPGFVMRRLSGRFATALDWLTYRPVVTVLGVLNFSLLAYSAGLAREANDAADFANYQASIATDRATQAEEAADRDQRNTRLRDFLNPDAEEIRSDVDELEEKIEQLETDLTFLRASLESHLLDDR